MKHLSKILLFAVLLFSFTSCEDTTEGTYFYTLSNSTKLSDNILNVMGYVENTVDMSTESLMSFSGTMKEADDQAIAEFNKRLQSIKDEAFCKMMNVGDYYELKLNRLASDDGDSEVIATKRYDGTKAK